MPRMDLIQKIKKMNRIIDKSRKAISLYSSFLAGAFIAVSFLFTIYFIPYGSKNWHLDWVILTIFTVIYCIIYYNLGIILLRKKYSKEIATYKKDFFASLFVSVYFSIIILFKFIWYVILIDTVISLVILFIICYKIAHKRYERRR